MSTTEHTEQAFRPARGRPTPSTPASPSRAPTPSPPSPARYRSSRPPSRTEQLIGIAQDREHPDQGREPPGAPAPPEFLDAERYPEADVRLERDPARRRQRSTSTARSRSRGSRSRDARTATGPAIDHFGENRFGLQLQTTVDRTTLDINWNMPLPNGDPALANDVTLKADLTLVAQDALTMRVLAISGSLRADSINTALLRALREEAPAASRSSCGTASRTSRPTTPTTTSSGAA